MQILPNCIISFANVLLHFVPCSLQDQEQTWGKTCLPNAARLALPISWLGLSSLLGRHI